MMTTNGNIEKKSITQAVKDIKSAILLSQSRAVKMISGEELSLYFGVGNYVSLHTRHEGWGKSVVENISIQLRKELPGLRGFSVENIKKMRTFAEFWKPYILKWSAMPTDFKKTQYAVAICKYLMTKCASPTKNLQ